MTLPNAIPYGFLCQPRLGVDQDYLDELWALYSGGKDLLCDDGIMRRLFPQHPQERNEVYRQRKACAQYTNHAGALIDLASSGMIQDPLEITAEGTDAEYWEDWAEDVSPPGAESMTANQLEKATTIQRLVFGCSWVLVDMPRMGVQFESEVDQERAGALNVYAKPIDPRSVLEWEKNDNGDLKWALLRFVDRPRPDPMALRIVIRERYYMYTQAGWALYTVQYHDPAQVRKAVEHGLLRDKDVVEKPEPSDMIAGVVGSHNFGRVPLVHTTLDPGLWAMNKLHSLGRAYFNRESAYHWFLLKVHYPILYEFVKKGIDGIDGTISQHDPGRATNQTRGIGYIQERDVGDRAEFVGPNPASLGHMLESMRALRDELHRVVHLLHLAAENSASTVKRSGESKAEDRKPFVMLLRELGRIGRDELRQIYELGSMGRAPGREPAEIGIKGFNKFEDQTLSEMVQVASLIEGISVPSATFWVEFKSMLARVVMGSDLPEDKKEEIRAELEAAITQDQFVALRAMMDDNDDSEDEDLEDDEEQGDDTTSKASNGRIPASTGRRESDRGRDQRVSSARAQ